MAAEIPRITRSARDIATIAGPVESQIYLGEGVSSGRGCGHAAPGDGAVADATTFSAIALALATLMEDRGPHVSGVYLIAISLLFAGLVALAGSLLAIEDVWEEVSGIESDWLACRLLFNEHEALFFSTWAIRLIGATYFWLLVEAAP